MQSKSLSDLKKEIKYKYEKPNEYHNMECRNLYGIKSKLKSNGFKEWQIRRLYNNYI